MKPFRFQLIGEQLVTLASHFARYHHIVILTHAEQSQTPEYKRAVIARRILAQKILNLVSLYIP